MHRVWICEKFFFCVVGLITYSRMLKPDRLKGGSRNLSVLLAAWDLGDSSQGCNLLWRRQETKVSICCMCFCRCSMDCLFLANVNQLTKLPLFAAAQIILGFFSAVLMLQCSLLYQCYECVAFFYGFFQHQFILHIVSVVLYHLGEAAACISLF